MGDLGVGSVIGGLRIDAVAGSGGMGVVYRATQLGLNRTVAVKVVAPGLAEDPEFRERFKRESELAASIDHPNVTPIYFAGEEDGQLYVAMRFVDGTDLRELIQRKGRLDPVEAADIVHQIGEALDAAHSRGLVHRDVKPANILLGVGDGGRAHAYLTDFGLTKQWASAEGLTKTGVVLGTVDYIAPEQLEGRPVDGRVDVYALGCVFYQALTGQVPFPRHSEAAKMWAHMGQPPPRLAETAPDLPRELDEVLARAMAKQPDERFATAGEFGRAAVAAAAGAMRTATGATVIADATGAAAVAAATGATAVAGTAAPVAAGAAPVEGGGVGQWPGTAVPVTTPVPAGWGPGQQFVPDAATYQFAPSASGPGSLPGAAGPAGWSPAYGYPPPYGSPWPSAQPPTPKGRLPLVLGIIGGLVVLALVAGVLAFVVSRAPAAPPAPPAPTAAGEIIGSPIKVGKEPSDIVAGGGFLWTANANSGTISKIDPKAGTSTDIGVGGVPNVLAVDQGAVWVSNYLNSIVRVDIATEAVSDPIDTGPGEVAFMAGGGGYLWLSHSADGTVSRINLQTQKLEGQPVKVGAMPLGMWFSNELLYVYNTGDQTLVALDGRTGQVVGNPLKVDKATGGPYVYKGVIYFVAEDGLIPVDERTFIIGSPIPFPKGWSNYDVGAGSLWVAYPIEKVIRRYDLPTGMPHGEPIKNIGDGVNNIVFIDGVLNVLDGPSGTVTRIRPNP